MTEYFDEINCSKLIISSENGKGFISLSFDDDGSPYVMLVNENAGGTNTGHIHISFGDDGSPSITIGSADLRGGTIRIGTDHDSSSIVLSTNDRYSNSNPPSIMITTDGNDSMITIEDETILKDRSTRQIDT